MEYLFRLPDGRRLALWSERNQIVRMVSGGGNRSQNVIRSDFLSDLAAAMYDGKIYFVYQNTAAMVMFHLPDDEEDVLLFGERLESCRHGALTLFPWQEKLYLFYAAWNPVREKYALKLRELPVNRATDGVSDGTADRAESGPGPVADNGARPELELLRDQETEPMFQVLAEGNALCVLIGEDCLRLTRAENGEECWEKGKWISKENLIGLQMKIPELETERSGLLRQVSELEEERSASLSRISELEEAHEASQIRIAEMNTERDSLLARLNGAEHEHEILQEQIRELEGGIAELQQERGNFRDQINELQQERGILQNRITELQTANRLLNGQRQSAESRLASAVDQYNKLAELTRQLQQEGKKWRDRYYQETKRKNERTGAVKVKRIRETQP